MYRNSNMQITCKDYEFGKRIVKNTLFSEFNLVRKKVKPNDFSSVVEKFSECDVNEKP